MAHITYDDSARRGILSSMFHGMMDTLTRAAESSHRMKEIERLQGLSDAELAKRGLTREGIAHHVFRDIYYV
ncbi:DUF1127 domain-containing protein [Sagittula sp. SSi028]|uniref:DUF1127 domain-containing protein n=1 Tax=Sagittula sp. SSi028 TaxID=3400636 RepID=UPI003AF4310A